MQILNEYIYEYVTRDVVWKPYSWVGIVVAVAVIVGVLWLTIDLDIPAASSIIIGLLLVLTFFLFFVQTTKTEVMRYEVVLTEDISWKEFNNKYTLIEQRGDILVIEEKNNESN